MREDEALGRVVRIGQMNLHPLAVGVRHGVKVTVAAAAAERGDDLVAARAEQVHDLQDIRRGHDARLHAPSFSRRTGTRDLPSPAAPSISRFNCRTK